MAQDPSPSAVVLFLGRKITWPQGVTLFDALMQAGVMVPSACAGHGQCALCVVWLTGAVLPPANPREQHLLSKHQQASGARLACQQRAHAPWTIDRVGVL